MDQANTTIFDAIYELETSQYFDELVNFANTEASVLEKAMIYFSIIETFAKILTLEFVNKHKTKGQEIQSGWKEFKNKKGFEYKDQNGEKHIFHYNLNGLQKILTLQKYSNIAAWDEIVNKIGLYIPYRNILAHNIFIDEENKKVRSIEEINQLAYTASELADEIYLLIIGAREYLDFEFDEHNQELNKYPEIERSIWSKKQDNDWSALPCEGATIEDLDEEAIKKAKQAYIEKNYQHDDERKEEIKNNDTATFLSESKLNIGGQITKTTILLLGKPQSVHFLNSMAEILWEENGTEAYKKFKLPFIFTIDDLANHIRIRDIEYPVYIVGQQTGSNGKIPNYTFKNLREAISNCVAHQDYEMQEKILVYESVDKIVFKNAGKPLINTDQYEEGLKDNNRNFTPTKYRNKWLYEAMDTLGLVEGRGSGFRKIFNYSTKKAFLPAPTPNFDLPDRFEYTIYGSEIDPVFTQILIQQKDLDIGMILLLDRVQKFSNGISEKPIEPEQHKILRKQGLVEGRYPKLYLSAEIMEALDQKEDYIKNKGFDEVYYVDLVISYLEQYSRALRTNISKLLQNKLPEDGTNKYEKVSNILRKMKKYNIVDIDKSKGTQNALWYLTNNYKENLYFYKRIYKGKT